MTSLFKALERADAERRLLGQVESPTTTVSAAPPTTASVPATTTVSVPATTTVAVPRTPRAAPAVEHTEYEKLAVKLMLEATRRPLKEVLLLSAIRSEGVSTVTLGVGTALARSVPNGVVLVEAHTGESTLADRLGVEPRWGIDDVLAGKVELRSALVPTRVPGLSLLANVGSNSRALAGARAAGRLKRLDDLRPELRAEFDFCLVDGGSLEQSPDAAALSSAADGVLVVVEAERTSATKVQETMQILLHAKASILGVVLNRRREYLPAFVRRRIQ